MSFTTHDFKVHDFNDILENFGTIHYKVRPTLLRFTSLLMCCNFTITYFILQYVAKCITQKNLYHCQKFLRCPNFHIFSHF